MVRFSVPRYELVQLYQPLGHPEHQQGASSVDIAHVAQASRSYLSFISDLTSVKVGYKYLPDDK